ncbi:jg12096, partial [Pararge aegeria aegeria]
KLIALRSPLIFEACMRWYTQPNLADNVELFKE